ncbi:hypothetical protein, partial [Nonomuraea thailandensis]
MGDNRIYINSAREDQPFGGWQEVQGNGQTHDALAAAGFGSRLYVFGAGTDNRIYVNSAREDQPFGGW